MQSKNFGKNRQLIERMNIWNDVVSELCSGVYVYWHTIQKAKCTSIDELKYCEDLHELSLRESIRPGAFMLSNKSTTLILFHNYKNDEIAFGMFLIFKE